jgi:hypothetical protein
MRVTLHYQQEKGLERELRRLFQQEVARALPRLAEEVRDQTAALIDLELRTSAEWEAIQSGSLREHFGLRNPTSALEAIARAVRLAVRVETRRAGSTDFGGLSVVLLNPDLAGVLSLPDAAYDSINAHGVRTRIPWLRWFLLEGDRIILTDVEINTSRASRPGSRTGRAIMVRPGSGVLGRRRDALKRAGLGRRQRASAAVTGWGVPELGGTREDNWLTRVAARVAADLPPLIEQAFARI